MCHVDVCFLSLLSSFRFTLEEIIFDRRKFYKKSMFKCNLFVVDIHVYVYIDICAAILCSDNLTTEMMMVMLGVGIWIRSCFVFVCMELVIAYRCVGESVSRRIHSSVHRLIA